MEHNLQKRLFAQVLELLQARNLILKKGTIVDSGYLGAEKRKNTVTPNNEGKKIAYKINRRPSQSKNNSVRSQG